ncbi:ABC1 kinase family protein [Aromatoleum petrolei]|uniref:Ubiquinone biosynthesis protein UbiB n=1 Tax=Aromatoleum petrolei TaxID=76116 RepID=A0ABX1MR32_9RHOO|nr:AarF/UbiB family protein [Aromatoleum petrolei]NMF87597.1 ubiquinone biosynthesis protein UbiB [Aromatoleum petrolei]QTQ38696.1 UbiB domain-containing protein [Aromatoleum petrolei]
MLWKALGAARELTRAHDIAAVLIRYGFGDLVRRIGLADTLERAGKALHWTEPEELARLEPPARVRRAFEELGPTFIKLGQILATRVDLFPPEWIAEFGRLQDSAPAVPFEQVREQLTEDLGEAPEAAFAELDTQPLAAASLAQVYRARLADGRPVILKVRRPGIRPTIEADLRLLARLAEIVEAEAPDLRRYRPCQVVREFTLSLRREIDFAAECRYAERVAASFIGHPEIVIPRVHWQWCGERLNVQDYVEGIPGRDLAAVDAAGLERKLLARRGASAVLKMMLEDGFFHADPHPGNVFYLHGNRIAFIDFGMVGRLSETRRYELAMLLNGLVSNDAATVADVLLEWRDSEAPETEPELLRHEIDTFVDQYKGVPLKQLDIGAMLSDLVMILREHGIALPSDLSLLIKAFITLEGMGRQLDPDFDMGAEAAPFLRRVLLAHHAPGAVAKRGWRTLAQAMDLVTDLPRDLSQLLRSARRGKLQVQVDIVSLKRLGDQVDRAATRMTIGIVTAALIIGSAIVMTVVGDPGFAALDTLGLLGFAGAVAGGVALLLSIWHGGRGE